MRFVVELNIIVDNLPNKSKRIANTCTKTNNLVSYKKELIHEK